MIWCNFYLLVLNAQRHRMAPSSHAISMCSWLGPLIAHVHPIEHAVIQRYNPEWEAEHAYLN